MPTSDPPVLAPPATEAELRLSLDAAYKQALEEIRKRGGNFANRNVEYLGWRIGPGHAFARQVAEWMYRDYRYTEELVSHLTVWSSRGEADQRSHYEGWHAHVVSIREAAFVEGFKGRASADCGHYEQTISGLVSQGKPSVIAAPVKTGKTTLAAVATAAVLTGSKFLGRATQRSGVFVLTMETTPIEFQGKVEAAIGKTKVVDGDRGQLLVTARKDVLGKKWLRSELIRYLKLTSTRLAIIDPLCLFMTGSTDLASSTKRIRALTQPFADAGCGVLFLHHFVKSITPGEKPQFAHLNGAGIAEHADGWLLLNRKTDYDGGGVHDLTCLGGNRNGAYWTGSIRIDERSGLKVDYQSSLPSPPPPPPSAARKPRGAK